MMKAQQALAISAPARLSVCMLAGVLCASTVQAAPIGDPGASAALRRACASGALTPYTCAQHGITTTHAAAAAPASAIAPGAAAIASAAPAANTVAPAVAVPIVVNSAPAGPRDRRRRAQADVGPAVRPFQDTKRRYDLEIPEGWQLKMQGGVTAFSHGDAWIQLRTAAAPSPQAAAAAGVDLLRAQYGSFATSADADATIGGRPGRRMVLSAKSNAGRPSSIVVVAATMSGGENLILIAGGDPADAAVIDGGVSAIVRTLHFR